jgi:hypothetical protein
MRDRTEILMNRMIILRELTANAACSLNNSYIVGTFCSESGIEILILLEKYIDEMKDIASELNHFSK